VASPCWNVAIKCGEHRTRCGGYLRLLVISSQSLPLLLLLDLLFLDLYDHRWSWRGAHTSIHAISLACSGCTTRWWLQGHHVHIALGGLASQSFIIFLSEETILVQHAIFPGASCHPPLQPAPTPVGCVVRFNIQADS
jgi:hypothetical protein